MDISVGEIFENGGDQHDEQIRVVIEEERAHEVPDSFEDKIFVLREVDGVDMGEGSRVS